MKLKKLNFKKEDYQILNDDELDSLRGGERTKIKCGWAYKVYECVNFEVSCPAEFTSGDCGVANISCSNRFTTRTF